MPRIEYGGDKNRVLSTNAIGEPMANVMSRRFSRRAAVAGAVASGATLKLGLGTNAGAQTPAASATPAASPVTGDPTLTFTGLSLQTGEEVIVPEGYTALPFLR